MCLSIYICNFEIVLCISIYSIKYVNNECLLIIKLVILWFIYYMVFLMYLIYFFLLYEYIYVLVVFEEKINVEC